ncbi:malate dehydrogenase [Mycolicibacterium sp. P1-18]|uniref:malate dehydrogenase n=1 Tax=Mycolicibacterium sp. P1-18 TaxID=2024615 RepID=UPI0011F32BA5|nr:malate dehydrogenase [Mycolicibacterium sp. P1-18]KAA0099481.1 malate dehydrogenase [Mycolicibacterium sp. P1-18]
MTVSTDTKMPSLPTALGFTSVALGLSELLAPRGVARLAGVVPTERSRRALRFLGVRECGHGSAILLGSPRLVWTRVAGDVLDVALLAKALRSPGADRRRGAVAMSVLAVIGAADVWATREALRD